MKAYIIKIELLDSYPLIWRRVVMPADATFRRLHDVIQTVTNFLSGGSAATISTNLICRQKISLSRMTKKALRSINITSKIKSNMKND